MKKRIVLCADDYGQAPAISRGILTLIQAGRLTAASCMVNSQYWAEHAKWLLPAQPLADIGLHFNLSEGPPVSSLFAETYGKQLPSLAVLMRKTLFRQLDQRVVEAELDAQLDLFAAAIGRLPDFIDGHQHVHQFPVIRQALINVYQKRLSGSRVYIRLVSERIRPADLMSYPKKLVIHAMGTRKLRHLLRVNQIPHNTSFAGIYDFATAAQYADMFPALLDAVKDNGLIMCHPAISKDIPEDVIADARYCEYQYLAGNQFLQDCRKKHVVLSKFI